MQQEDYLRRARPRVRDELNGQWPSKHRVQSLVYKHKSAPLDHLALPILSTVCMMDREERTPATRQILVQEHA